jgi:hypothetical protein
MADLSAVRQTSDNSGNAVAAAYLPANSLKHVINQADVGRELIVKVALSNMTNANVTAIRNAITLPGGVAGVLPADTGDAFTVAAIGTADGSAFESGVTDVVFMRVQGTGTFSTVDAAGATGATVTVEAVFQPAQ